MNYVDLGKKIRQVRRQKSMTQEQLAEKAGISASFLGQYRTRHAHCEPRNPYRAMQHPSSFP